MKPTACALSLSLLATAAAAQEAAPAYQHEEDYSFKLRVDALVRQEWTRDIFVSATETRKEDRRRGRLLPRFEIGVKKLRLGVGGDFNFGSDRNVEPKPALLRDNYDSRDARLDLAFASLKPASWLQLQGGRFAMPVGLTEMLWDKDLRPQGGALTLETHGHGSLSRLGVTGVYGQGSHVFDDDKTKMLLVSAEAVFTTNPESKIVLTASYLEFRDVALEPMIRRQNTRLAGVPAPAPVGVPFKVFDGIIRLRHEGQVPSQIVADYSRNTAIGANNGGLWLALVVGSTQSARGSLDYTFAKVDKDATLGAYATDDFFWATGWKGHRVDLGLRGSDHVSVHGIGQVQQFKDSPRPEERDHWVKRYRIETRVSY